VHAGYEPSRVHHLTRCTLEAIDSLQALASSDPVAADAMRTILLTRRNLEDHWMPALRDIESSDAMVRWRASRVPAFGLLAGSPAHGPPDHLGTRTGESVTIPARRRRWLLTRLDLLERRAMAADTDRAAGIDATGNPAPAAIEELGRRLSWWVARDDGFAAELAALSTSNMQVGRLLGTTKFPIWFRSEVVRQMAVPNGPDTGVDHDRYAASLSAAVTSLVDDPAACLDLLLDQPTAYALAAWSGLTDAALSDFVVSGLGRALVDDPTRLQDGYDVLGFMTRAANGPLDHGFNPAMALGLATAMPTYVDVLAESIVSVGDEDRVMVASDAAGVSADFGTYTEFQGLFGAIMRHRSARLQLGAVTATWAHDTIAATDRRTGFDAALHDVSTFTSMLLDAADHEQEQVVAEFEHGEASRAAHIAVVAWGVDLAIGARGAGARVRSATSTAIRTGAAWIDDDEPGDVAATGLGEEVRRQMMVAAITVGLASPTVFENSDDERLSVAERRWVSSRLDDIRTAPTPGARARHTNHLLTNIDGTPLDAALNAVKSHAAATRLQGR
jgi:hypothetical protein